MAPMDGSYIVQLLTPVNVIAVSFAYLIAPSSCSKCRIFSFRTSSSDFKRPISANKVPTFPFCLVWGCPNGSSVAVPISNGREFSSTGRNCMWRATAGSLILAQDSNSGLRSCVSTRDCFSFAALSFYKRRCQQNLGVNQTVFFR